MSAHLGGGEVGPEACVDFLVGGTGVWWMALSLPGRSSSIDCGSGKPVSWFFLIFWPYHMACGIPVLRPVIESMPPA